MSTARNHAKRSHQSQHKHFGGARARLRTSYKSRAMRPNLGGLFRRFRTKIFPQTDKATGKEEAEK
ncbi:MAG: hypothetical protein IK149_01625 [Oscillospiraceae bacterium]|nr:hypothetical protein [Oscillospiraceae bacterium]